MNINEQIYIYKGMVGSFDPIEQSTTFKSNRHFPHSVASYTPNKQMFFFFNDQTEKRNETC